jgi:hypothetical protein
MSDFPPEIRAAINAARARLSITHDADQKTIRVDGMSHRAWMVFVYALQYADPERRLAVIDAATNIRYNKLITGVEVPSLWEITAAWESARAALESLSDLLPSVHTLYTSRITSRVASYLAMRDRVQQWGGFTGERDRLPYLLKGLTDAERRAVDDRLAGAVVL